MGIFGVFMGRLFWLQKMRTANQEGQVGLEVQRPKSADHSISVADTAVYFCSKGNTVIIMINHNQKGPVCNLNQQSMNALMAQIDVYKGLPYEDHLAWLKCVSK